MPLLDRKRVILAKRETAYGADPVPTGAANAVLVSNLTVTPQEADLVDRTFVRGFLGRDTQTRAAMRAMVQFDVEMQASGTLGTAPAYADLLKACGMSETISAGVSVTYRPVSDLFDSVTIYLNVDGVLHKMTGARGTVSLSMKVKEIPVFSFSFTGLYQPVIDAALPTPTYTAYKTPLPVTNINTSAFTLHGYAAIMSEFSMDVGHTVVHRTLVGGAEQVLITDRNTTGSVTIEAVKVAQKNFWDIAYNSTLGAVAITHGVTAGQKVQINGGQVQLATPQYGELDGISMFTTALNFVPTTAGNDEFSIVML